MKLWKVFLILSLLIKIIFYPLPISACDPDTLCGDEYCCSDSLYNPCGGQPRICIPAGGGGDCSGPQPVCTARDDCGERACNSSPICIGGEWGCSCTGEPPCGGGGETPTPTPTGTCPAPGKPTNLQPAGSVVAGAKTLSWTNGGSTTHYNIFVKNETSGSFIVNGPQVNVPTASYGPVTFQAGNNYTWWVTAHNGGCNQRDSDPYSIIAVAQPNCKNISGSSSLLFGDTGTYSATYENGGGAVTSIAMQYLNTSSTCASVQHLSSSPRVAGAGEASFDWTPPAIGNYYLYCRAINDNTAPATECLGMCTGSSPPQYTCVGPDAYTTVPVTVNNPSSWWYKTKDTSLHKVGDIDLQILSSINKFTDADPDDSTSRAIIIGQEGLGTVSGNFAPGPSYNPMKISVTNGWVTDNYTVSSSFISSYYDTIKSRKSYTAIDTLDSTSVTQNTINVIKGNQTIDSSNANITSKGPFVLVVRNAGDTAYGDITIDVDNFNDNGSGTPITSLAIIANKITFTTDVINADGIFIALQTEVQGTGSDANGLKIKGNLVSSSAVLMNRVRTTVTRPTLFVVMQPSMFVDLLPYLSTSIYDQTIN